MTVSDISTAPLQSIHSATSQSALGATSSQEAVAGRGFTGNGSDQKKSSIVNTNSDTVHNKTGSLSQGKGHFLPAVPSVGGPINVNGKNAVNAAQSNHYRQPSFTISASGISGSSSNGEVMAGKPAVANSMPLFGSLNQSAHSPSIANSNLQSSGSLNPHSPNPRITSPQNSPSPIPQPGASGGRPPSSLQGANASVSFGNFGPEEANRHQRPSISGMSSGALTPNMAPVALKRESSQQSNNDMNGNMNMNSGRGGYHGGRGGRGGFQGNHITHHQQGPYSPNPSYRQMRTPSSAGPGSHFPQSAPRTLSYQGSQISGRPSPSMPYAQPVIPGAMGMASPGMQGQPQFYAQNMAQPVIHHFSFTQAQTQAQAQKKDKSQAITEPTTAHILIPAKSFNPLHVAVPTTLSPESGQFEQFLTARMQGPYFMADGQYYPSPFTPGYPIPPQQLHQQMQIGQTYYHPQSPRPHHATTHQQGQFMPSQYSQQPTSMSRTPSGMGDRSVSSVQPPSTPMTPAVHPSNPPSDRPSPAPKPANEFIVPKKTGGIKIVNPNTREELKIEKAPESPAIIPPSKSPATVSAVSTPPSRTPDIQGRADNLGGKNQSEIAKKFKADIENKLNAEKVEAEKLKQQTGSEDKEVSTEEPEVEKPAETSTLVTESKAEEPVKAEEVKATETVKTVDDTPVIIEPPKSDSPEPERELTEEDDEYWERLAAEELAKEEEQERAYQAKKAIRDAEKAKDKAEEEARLNEELKRQEAEAEAREEARQKKSAAQDDDDEGKDLFAALKRSENAFKATESPAAESSGMQTPTSDASSTVIPLSTRAAASTKNKPAALKLETTKPVEAPTPSAALQSLRSARFLSRIDDKTYPAAIASPNPALNSAAPMGKFRYDKNFLMQFQSVFTEKPSETWSDKIRETVGDADTPQTAKPGRSQTMGSSHRPSSTPKSIPAMHFQPSGGGGMGSFVRGSTSEERFKASTRQPSNKPYAMQHGGFPGVFGAPTMQRTASSTSIGHPQSPRNNPSRGGRGGSRAGGNTKHDAKANASMPLTAGKDVENLQISETGWKPLSISQNASAGPPPGGDSGYLAPDVVQRKVKSSLNKMTPTTFDKISRQIIEIVMQSKQETDGRTLRQIIQLTFEKATDEAHWAQMYAEFCSRMLHSMTPEIKDETLGLDKNQQVPSGNTLFRRYLLNRCQQDFEAGWKSKLPDRPQGESGEAAMLSDEYYAAAAAKRRGLGLVKFIGELYKLGMLTSRIMVMCVQRLLEYDGTPEEAEIESLNSLLSTIGEGLDHDEKGRPAMNAFFQRIGEILKIQGLPNRMQFMLMDLIDLRRANWKGKNSAAKGPATIDQIRAQVRLNITRDETVILILLYRQPQPNRKRKHSECSKRRDLVVAQVVVGCQCKVEVMPDFLDKWPPQRSQTV